MGNLSSFGGAGLSMGSLSGSKRTSKAIRKAAQAQERAAREQLDFAKQTQERAIAAAESPEEFAALSDALERQKSYLDKQSELFDAIDPAILEASGQALQLLRGQESKALDPIRKQRDRQKQSLLNSLREQLGPGAETSTAGMQALSEFDAQTDQLLAGKQESSLAQLFGIASAGASNRGALNQGAQSLAGIGSAFGNIAQRRVGAITGSSPFVASASQGVVGSAGSRFAGQIYRGQAQERLFGQLLGAGITGTTAALTGGLSLAGAPSSGAAANSAGQSYNTEVYT